MNIALFAIVTRCKGQLHIIAHINLNLTKDSHHRGVKLVAKHQIGWIRASSWNIGLTQEAIACVGTIGNNHFTLDVGNIGTGNPADIGISL